MQTLTSTVSPSSVTRSPSILRALVQTDSSWIPTVARITLGVVMLPHGLQKTAGWFGGYGYTNTMHWFTETMNVPWIFAFAAVATESLGALLLIAGLGSRLAAAGVGAVFLTAVAMVHAPHGFFMNWDGAQKGEGFEYFLLGLALVAIVIFKGGGAASVDRRLSETNS